MRIRRSLVLLSLTAAAVTGCTSGEDGNPNPTGSNTQGTSAPSTSSQAASRPKNVDLSGVESCKTLTDTQKAELQVDRAVDNPLDIVKTGKDAPNCSYRGGSTTSFSYNVSLVTDKGIDYWTEGGNLDVESTEVSNFPAKQVKLSGTGKGDCSVAVDVSDGQQLFVQFLPIGSGFTQDQMCTNAKKGAELALATVQTLQ